MSKILPIPFFYIRHGETDWNVENRAMGQADIPLNSRGIEQAHQARQHLIHAGIATICHSPLIRAKTTAQILNETLKCTLVEIEELREFNLGPHSGKIKEEWFQEWRSGKELDGAELYDAFIDRCLTGINCALQMQGPVLIVAHGGVYWSVQKAIEFSLEKGLPNCIPIFHCPLQNGTGRWNVSAVTE